MLLFDYQSACLLQRFHVPTLPYYTIESEIDIDVIINRAPFQAADIHVYGQGQRKKKTAHTKREVTQYVQELVIKKEKKSIEKIIVTPFIAPSIEKEIYLTLTIDKKSTSHVLMVSSQSFEDSQHTSTQSDLLPHIFKETLSLQNSLHRFQYIYLASKLQIDIKLQERLYKVIDGLIKAYFHFDATILKICPLAITTTKSILAIDPVMAVDPNALYRQPEIQHLYTTSYFPSLEHMTAAKFGLRYFSFEKGSIGCLANGQDLAMATVDLIHFWNGVVANCIDIGDEITEEKIVQGCTLIASNLHIKVIFIHIFCGIRNCDVVAKACIRSLLIYKQHHPDHIVPSIVVRMEGMQVAHAKKIIQESQLPIYTVSSSSLDTSIQKIVSLSR